jgi:hypothetical protein
MLYSASLCQRLGPSGKFALYYTLFSNDVLRLKSVIRESRYSGCFLHRKHAWNILATPRTLCLNGKQSELEEANFTCFYTGVALVPGKNAVV